MSHLVGVQPSGRVIAVRPASHPGATIKTSLRSRTHGITRWKQSPSSGFCCASSSAVGEAHFCLVVFSMYPSNRFISSSTCCFKINLSKYLLDGSLACQIRMILIIIDVPVQTSRPVQFTLGECVSGLNLETPLLRSRLLV